MELSLAADPGVALVAAGVPAAPGTDPDDAAAEAFAALLAALVVGHPNVPAPESPALPGAGSVVDATSTVVVTVPAGTDVAVAAPAEAPVGAIVPAAIALPAAVVPALTQGADPLVDPLADDADPAAEVPAPTAPAADVAPEVAAPATDAPEPFSSRSALQSNPQRDENAEGAPAAPTTAAAVVDAPASFSSPAPPQGGGERDQNATAAPITATTTRAPERVTPEIVRPAVATAPPPPVEQVVRAVAPLRQLGDGTHQVVLELRPADLGVVRVELSLDAGVIHLGLRAEAAATGDLLRAALPELRQQLDGAGLVAGRLAVDANGTGTTPEGRQSWRADPDAGSPHQHPADADPGAADEQPHTAYSTSAYGQIDVLL